MVTIGVEHKMETIITEWNTIIRLQDNLWLKIEEPKKKQIPVECTVSLHYINPNLDKKSNEQDSMEIDYIYHKEQYENQDDEN